MNFPQFLSSLFSDGRLTAGPPAPLTGEDWQAADMVLADAEGDHRLNMPGSAPSFSLDDARWAAELFYRACQCAVYRDLDEQTLAQLLQVPRQGAAGPAAHYSVDLVFQYLPSLAKFARSAAESDPLVVQLQRWASEWPLSSVGMPGIENINIDGFAGDRCLLQLYVDRIIASGDKSRLADARVRDAMRGAIGPHAQLAAGIALALNELESTAASP